MSAGPAMARVGAERSRGLSAGAWLQGLGCGAAVALAAPSALLALILLTPGGLALLLDREPGRIAGRATLLFGAAVAAGPVARLWASGAPLSAALATAADPGVLLSCWLAQSAGWLALQLAPLLLRLAMDAHAATQTARLRAERSRYEQDWGVPPTGAG